MREIAKAVDADTYFNIYYSTFDPELANTMLEAHRRHRADKNSQSVDPLFVDPENCDFSLRPDSPALKMGFVPIDVSRIGLLKEE